MFLLLYYTASEYVTVEANASLRHSWSGMHRICIGECIGPESFSAQYLLWHHQNDCFIAFFCPRYRRFRSAERCMACRLRALASVHWCIFAMNLLWRRKQSTITEATRSLFFRPTLSRSYGATRIYKWSTIYFTYFETKKPSKSER